MAALGTAKLTEAPVNLNEMEGIPEKARKGKAASAICIGCRLRENRRAHINHRF